MYFKSKLIIRFKPKLLHSGDATDRGANAKKSSTLFVGEDDHVDCFNHGLKTCCDVVYGTKSQLGTSVEASRDFNTLHCACVLIRSHIELRSLLLQAQIDSCDFRNALTVIADAVTRWEGKYTSTERFTALSQPLTTIYELRKKEFTGW